MYVLPNASQSHGFDPWLIWVTIRRCWFWALPMGLMLAAVASYFVFQTFVPEYQATHVLEANHDYVVFKGVLAAPRDFSRVERQLLTNSLVLDPVLADPEVCEAPSLRNAESREREIRSRMTIGNAGTDSLLTVTYRDPDPQYAAFVCNAIVDSYMRQRETFDSRRISDLEGWLRPAIDQWEAEVKTHQERVRELSRQAHGYDPYQQISRLGSDMSMATALFAQLTDVKGDEEVLQAQIKSAMAATEEEVSLETLLEPSPDEVERRIATDPQVVRLQSRLNDKRGYMRNMEDRDLVRINRDWYNRLASEAVEFERELRLAKEAARKRVVPMLQELEQQRRAHGDAVQLEAMRGELASLQSKRALLEASFAEEKRRLEQLSGETADLFFAQQEYAQAAAVLEKLNTRIASLRTERLRGATMQTLAVAKPPATPIEEVPMKKIMMAGGGALVVPFLFGLLWELNTKRVTTPALLESQKLAPVLGEIASLPSGAQGGRRQRVFEESVEALRANLLLSREFGTLRSIAVTSSLPGEGKSSLASQLAVAMAQASGEPVLLVDADIRRPDQHHLFGLDLGPGLVDVLSGKITLDAAIDRSLGELIHVLPAGELDASPHRLLSPSALRDLLDQSLEDFHYRYVIFDTAPVLSAGETLAVAAEVDAALLCVMRDVSRVSSVERTIRRLEATGATVAGTVFNGVPSRHYAYRYGDYRYAMKSSVVVD
ncbi:polysaccharide biosynthesis tyrosine autokinase [Candidatus Laterigemmans baculatus]|uniref:polysaccharide biosynthesis tyrosine autokinase n=1 Tax=Candidatus Laterigemmans baculatus TaxID=2770505 RepID=UPI0013DA3B4F|nr:polysaccharide biosynthesis tyrosine autokinase [Candidatus Laterigemmans baculatus]